MSDVDLVNHVEFIFNSGNEISLKVGEIYYLIYDDILQNEKTSYRVTRSGFYRFTGYWFWFLYE